MYCVLKNLLKADCMLSVFTTQQKKNCKASLISMNKAGWKFCTFKSLEIQFIEMNNNNCKLEDVP